MLFFIDIPTVGYETMTESTEQITYSTVNIHNVYVLVPDLGIHKLNTQ